MKNPIHKLMITSFHEWYLNEKKIPFEWDAVQVKSIDYLYAKILATCTKTNTEASDDMISQLWQKILNQLKETDVWIYDNVSVSLINSKYNPIVAKMIAKKASGSQTYQERNLELMKKMMNNGTSSKE